MLPGFFSRCLVGQAITVVRAGVRLAGVTLASMLTFELPAPVLQERPDQRPESRPSRIRVVRAKLHLEEVV